MVFDWGQGRTAGHAENSFKNSKIFGSGLYVQLASAISTKLLSFSSVVSIGDRCLVLEEVRWSVNKSGRSGQRGLVLYRYAFDVFVRRMVWIVADLSVGYPSTVLYVRIVKEKGCYSFLLCSFYS